MKCNTDHPVTSSSTTTWARPIHASGPPPSVVRRIRAGGSRVGEISFSHTSSNFINVDVEQRLYSTGITALWREKSFQFFEDE
jgi:hypothetical protein